MAHPPSQISLTSPITEHALRELARDGSFHSAMETSPVFNDTRETNRAGANDRFGILDESFDCSFPGIIARGQRPKFAFQSSLGTATNRRPFYRANSEPTNPHNTPASSSDDLSDSGSDRDQDRGHGRALSASATGRCASDCLQNDSEWINTSYVMGYNPETSNLQTQPSLSEIASGISSTRRRDIDDRQQAANNANNIKDETASPGGSLFGSSPLRTAGSFHVRFAGHPTRQRPAYNSSKRLKKPLWRPVSLHQRHPRRVSYRSPARTYDVSISRPEKSPSTGPLSVKRLPLPECCRQNDSINADLPFSQAPDVGSSARSSLASSNKSGGNVTLSSQENASQEEKGEAARVTVFLHKSHDSIWASPSGVSAIHMRIDWSIARPTSTTRRYRHRSRIARMDGASNLGQINFTIPVRLLQMIRAIAIAAQNLFSTRAALTVLKLVTSVMSLVIASAFWLVSKLWIDTNELQLDIDFGGH